MAEEKDVEMRCVEAVEKSKKVPEQKKQNKGEVEQVSDLSEEDLDVKANVLAVVERMSKQNDPAIQVVCDAEKLLQSGSFAGSCLCLHFGGHSIVSLATMVVCAGCRTTNVTMTLVITIPQLVWDSMLHFEDTWVLFGTSLLLLAASARTLCLSESVLPCLAWGVWRQ